MAKTEECESCQRFSGYCSTEFLVCGIHPSGPAETPCPDFAEVTERLEILETHPFFTGVCPECGETIWGEGLVHYDCQNCGFRDDLIN